MFYVKPEDLQPTPRAAIEAAKEDIEFVLLPDDLVLENDGHDMANRGYFLVVSKGVPCQHYEEEWRVVGKVRDFS